MVKGKYTWHMAKMCDLSHDKLRNLSYRAKANLQLRLPKKKKKTLVLVQKYYKESQPNTLKRLGV